MQSTFDKLYAESSKNITFNKLMKHIIAPNNILLAYRQIKHNPGSKSAGIDRLTISDLAQLSPNEVIDKVIQILTSIKGYLPKPIKKVDIPKPDGNIRSLGIPCIWDRLIQQCIIQILEPICEAKFSDNSFGYRPNRSVEHAIARFNQLVNRGKNFYIIEFDIESFFDNICHKKLMRQLWSFGIRDKSLLWIINRIIKTPIQIKESLIYPTKGITQGGIISPLLANIVLNELDHHIEDMWCNHPITTKYYTTINSSGNQCKSTAFAAMKKTKLKEMRIVRYADDFRIFCKSKQDAIKVKEEITSWLKTRLKLSISTKKTRIIDIRKQYSKFLGFKMKAISKGYTKDGHSKYVINSFMSDEAKTKCKEKLKEQIKRIKYPRNGLTSDDEVKLYNSIVIGIHNYYRIATHVSVDCAEINNSIRISLQARLKDRICKTGNQLSEFEKERFESSNQVRFLRSTGRPIYPIGYIKKKDPMQRKGQITTYTAIGRQMIHKNLSFRNKDLIHSMRNISYDTKRNTIEYYDNRISLFSAQQGKCAITGYIFQTVNEINCHHIIPKHLGGTDDYSNLMIIRKEVHLLIHGTKQDTIQYYLNLLKLTKDQIKEVNKLRKLCNKTAMQVS